MDAAGAGRFVGLLVFVALAVVLIVYANRRRRTATGRALTVILYVLAGLSPG